MCRHPAPPFIATQSYYFAKMSEANKKRCEHRSYEVGIGFGKILRKCLRCGVIIDKEGNIWDFSARQRIYQAKSMEN